MHSREPKKRIHASLKISAASKRLPACLCIYVSLSQNRAWVYDIKVEDRRNSTSVVLSVEDSIRLPGVCFRGSERSSR